MRVDIFCQVIDNYGDIGVCWRLAQQLAQHNTISSLRLFVDDFPTFKRIEPNAQAYSTLNGVQLYDWQHAQYTAPAELVIESFACELPATYVAAMPTHTTLWLNLDYLATESWADELHGLPSPQANGVAKHFFFPGFSPRTGGLLRPDAGSYQPADAAFWARIGVDAPRSQATAVFFGYAGAPINTLYQALVEDRSTPSWTLLLLPSSPTPTCPLHPKVKLQPMPYLQQSDFDILLDYADLNLVRGEDSFVRAIWANKPFIWQPYRQADGAHLIKLQAWLARTPFHSAIQHALLTWNQHTVTVAQLVSLLQQRTSHWQPQCVEYAEQLQQQPTLCTQLLHFSGTKHL